QPREREVEAGHARYRERVRLSVAVARERVERSAARIGKPEQPCPLVERLAGGVVERRAEHAHTIPAAVADVEQQRVAAAREQTRERWLEGGGLEEERRHVPVQVIDGDERQPPRP